MRLPTAVALSLVLVGGVRAASAEVVRVEVVERKSFDTYERVIARVHFAVDPLNPANKDIADLSLAPRNGLGLVEFASDLLLFRPSGVRRGTVFLEPVNRGRDQSLGLMSGAVQAGQAPSEWSLGDRFLLEHGFTVAFLGWQFDVPATAGLTFRTPWVDVQGIVRAAYVETGTSQNSAFVAGYCALDPNEAAATLTFRTRIDAAAQPLPRQAWSFGPDGCTVRVPGGLEQGLYEAVYRTRGSPVAGLGLAAIRDFASYLKHGPTDSALGEQSEDVARVIGFGYSQTGRLLREFVRDGFNADEHGQQAFDALFIASAGAGGGSFNHRFARPGDAGNSVLSIQRPVDVPPFTDDGLLARAKHANVQPKVFYTLSSTEYWARAASLTHTDEQGRDAPLDALSRLYFLAGTPHSAGPLPPARVASFAQPLNFADQRWPLRALVLALDAWVTTGKEPPVSRYPKVSSGELVPRERVRFPRVPSLPFPSYLPPVWPMNFGEAFGTTRVISREPPGLGDAYQLLVPATDRDGNDRGGVRLPEVEVPLGTMTGWNVSIPALPGMKYLAGLVGSFRPFPQDEDERDRTGDDRASIVERYRDRRDFLARIRRSTDALVRQGFVLAFDVPQVLERAGLAWDSIAGR